MASNSPDDFQRRLNLARNGGGVLFCGAGFSADCLNFEPDEELGTGTQLLNIFNTELKQNPPYRDLKNAADALHDQIADHGMIKLLKERFTVANVTSDMTDLLSYPWQSIYTTNYDNALELAAQAAIKPVEPLNNTDDPNTSTPRLPIIHLHGYVQKWDIENFGESCVLGADSYFKLTNVKKWLDRFRRDIEQAQIVIFVGFNAGDFHLNQAIKDVTGLREKAFFINRPTAQADPDVNAAQKRLGTPMFSGRAGLADSIRVLLAEDAPKEPRLASFRTYTPPDPATTVPTQTEIEDLFLYGNIEPRQLARDYSSDVSAYHVRRSAIDEALTAIAGGARIVLFDGYPCDGKTMVTAELAYRLSGTRPVYQMRQAYENLLNEIASILHYAPNAAFIIENCFDLPLDRLASIARQFDGQEGILILTSRTVAVDASPASMASLKALGSFWRKPLVDLDEIEARSLSDLADQIAGWRDFNALGRDARLRFILDTCKASLPHFLMRLLQSKYVTQRYREEFNKLSLTTAERSAIIIALYVAHIGGNAPVSALSNAMNEDYGAIVDSINKRAGSASFRLVRRSGGIIQTVPSIGAENILRNLFDDYEIVHSIIPVLKNLAELNRNDFEKMIFRQIMRFSILSTVVSSEEAINQFFEHIKESFEIRGMPLFWLQWHMAKCATNEFVDAEKFLKNGYTQAAIWERRTNRKFDRRQLDDRRAKFLMLRATKTSITGGQLSQDFKEAIALADKILRQDDPQHYPFETLAEIFHTFKATGHHLDSKQRKLINSKLDELKNYACRRIGVIPNGYQRDKAQFALSGIVGTSASGQV